MVQNIHYSTVIWSQARINVPFSGKNVYSRILMKIFPLLQEFSGRLESATGRDNPSGRQIIRRQTDRSDEVPTFSVRHTRIFHESVITWAPRKSATFLAPLTLRHHAGINFSRAVPLIHISSREVQTRYTSSTPPRDIKPINNTSLKFSKLFSSPSLIEHQHFLHNS